MLELKQPLYAPDEGGESGADGGEKSEVKTFTQDQVNELIGKTRKEASERKLKELGIDESFNKDAFKKYKDWELSQKSEADRINEEKQQLLKELAEHKQRANEATLKLKLREDGAEDVDYVLFKASKLISNDVDYDAAIAKLKSEQPNLFTKNIPLVTGNKNERKDNSQPKDLVEKYFEKYGIK